MARRDPLSASGDDVEDGGYHERGARPADWLMFALRAALRRKLLAGAVLIAGLAASGGYYAVKPPWYRVEAKVLAQRSQALPSVVRAAYEDMPARSAWELIHRRENLISLVRQTNLVERVNAAPEHPSIVDRLRGLAHVGSSRRPSATVDALVSQLDHMLVVVAEEGTINLQLDWRDPQQAYDLVQAALQNFLEARHLQEVTAIEEVITVLQPRALKLRAELDEAMDEARRRPVRAPRPVIPRPKTASEELLRLQAALEAKRRAVQELDEFRRRRVAELQVQLDQARTQLSDAHPTVVRLRSDIETASKESHQMLTLRDEERKLAKEYSDRAAREGVATASAGAAPTDPTFELSPAAQEDERVREARLRFEQLTTRISQAQLDLDAARAGFKYRYNVIWPPQLPDAPVSPRAQKILGVGVIASLLLALFAAMLPDLLRGRIVEPWQVERALDLPVFGTVRRPR